jgi:hypothetical protein
MLRVAHVEAEDIGSGEDHLAKALRRLADGAKGADDFGFAQCGGHEELSLMMRKRRRYPQPLKLNRAVQA